MIRRDDLPPARLQDAGADRPELDAAEAQAGFRHRHHTRRREGREEPAGDQVVHRQPRAGPPFRRRAGRMDRGMVRRLDRAAARFQRGLGEQPLGELAVRGCRQPAEEIPEVERRWVHGVVRARIADLPPHVEVLRGGHRPRRGQALPGRLGEQSGRVEGRGWRLAALRPLDVRDEGGVLQAREGDHGLRAPEVPERAADRLRIERRIASDQGDVPKGSRHEALAVPLSVRDEPQGRRLHASRRQHLPAGAALEREESREHGAPREVDSLAGRRGFGERPIRVRQVVERAAHLARRHGAESRATGGQARASGPEGLQGLDPDELPLPIVVRREDDLVGRLGEAAERVVEGRGRLAPHRLDVDQRLRIDRAPVPIRIRIVDLDDVAAEREHDDVGVGGRERKLAEAVCPDLLSFPF